MSELFNFIQNHFPFLIEYKYLFLFLGALIEGFNSLIFGGFLASLEGVKFLPLWTLMVIGHCLNGYFWYSIGYFGGASALDKWGHKKKMSHEILENISRYFHAYSGRAILLAKFTWGLEIAMLILAGSFKYNLKSFSKYNFFGSLFWVSMTMGLGYVFGHSSSLFGFKIQYFAIFLASAIVLALFIAKFFSGALLRLVNVQEKFEKFRNNLKEKLEKLHKPDGDNLS